MKKRDLRHGYTTGACAAAAAKGAARMLRDQAMVDEVEITLPRGETVRFRLHGQAFGPDAASCYVVKYAGDDPDVTNGAEIHARVTLNPPRPSFAEGGGAAKRDLSKNGSDSPSPQPSPTRGEGAIFFAPPPSMGGGQGEGEIIIEGGVGVGRATKPGLAVAVGEWAINPVPRKMITQAVLEVFSPHPSPLTPHVVISIPNGEELAKKTLNARLGIVGGLSILGTTGIVRPVSSKAWTDTIDAAIDVALACGCPTLVLSTGRTSELAAQRSLALPEESYIMMGDHAGHALRACAGKGVREIVLAGQFAKLLKIACGQEQTHVSSSRLDLRTLAEWLEGSSRLARLAPRALRANTARELLESTGVNADLLSLVCGRAARFASELAPGCRVKVFLAGYAGEMLYFG